MSKKLKASQLKSGLDFSRELGNYPGCEVISDNDHTKIRLPDGSIELFPKHRQDLGKGLRFALIKHLKAAGVVIIGIFLVIIPAGYFLQNWY